MGDLGDLYSVGYSDGHNDVGFWETARKFPDYVMGYADGAGDRTMQLEDIWETIDISMGTLDLRDEETQRKFLEALKRWGVPIYGEERSN